MSNAYQIPLSGENETFTVSLGGTEYQLTFTWNDAEQGGWILDIATATASSDSSDETDSFSPLVSGIPVVTGCDLLGPYRSLGFTGSLIVYAEDSDAAPTEDTLGESCNLYYVPDDESDDAEDDE